MNTRKIFVILGALLTGGVFITIGSMVGHAEIAMGYELRSFTLSITHYPLNKSKVPLDLILISA
jgi:hypothetical protein